MKKYTFLILAVFLIANCAPQAPAETLNTATSTPQLTRTLTPTTIPSETATLTHTPTSTPIPIPTIAWTPLPTLSVQEKHTKIQDLLETNGGCELPCWWGITPNKTTWAETLHFLSSFMSYMKQGHPREVSQNGKLYIYQLTNIYFLTPHEEESVIWFAAQGEIVLGMSVFPPATDYKYQLHQLLSLLGIPREIYIVAKSTSLWPELLDAKIILDYSHIGVWAAYNYSSYENDEKLFICPQPVGPELLLNDPTISSSYMMPKEELVDTLGDHGASPRIIEEATNMTIDSFYNTFIDPASKACLETPANLWP